MQKVKPEKFTSVQEGHKVFYIVDVHSSPVTVKLDMKLSHMAKFDISRPWAGRGPDMMTCKETQDNYKDAKQLRRETKITTHDAAA